MLSDVVDLTFFSQEDMVDEDNEVFDILNNQAGGRESGVRVSKSDLVKNKRKPSDDSQKGGVQTRLMKKFMTTWMDKNSPKNSPRGSPVRSLVTEEAEAEAENTGAGSIDSQVPDNGWK